MEQTFFIALFLLLQLYLKKCIFSQITLKFLILSASAHTGFDHQSAKIPAKTCSMFPGHAHRTVLQDQKEYCNFKNFKQNILFYLSIRNNKLISWNQKFIFCWIFWSTVACSIISHIRLKPPFHSLSPPRRKLLEWI